MDKSKEFTCLEIFEMGEQAFKVGCIAVAIGFTLVFAVVVVPPLMENFDVIGALAAGFVNPYASGYSSDVIFCWLALAIWIIFEAKAYSVKGGWICLVLGMAPGVAVGFALYLLIRHKQINQTAQTNAD